MGKYEVEVEGHYTQVIEVEAESYDEAESFALRAFEQDVDVVTNMGGESWDHLSIAGVQEVEEDLDDYPDDIEIAVGVR